MYFDVHLDSVLAYVKYSQPDTVYEFQSLPSIPFPRKGYQAFAKGLHDEIKIKIKQGQISRDSVLSLRYFEMTVGRGQMIIADSQKFLVKPLDSFLSANRWTYGMSSGIPYLSKAEIVVQKDYLLDKLPWFGEPVNKLYEGSRDSWGELKLITPSKVGTQTTFFSRSLPRQNHKMVVIVSIIYDELLRKYCMPVVHFGNIKETRQLIDDIIASRESLDIYYDRIYFYRMK